MSDIFHHQSLRRRVHRNLEPLPHPQAGKRFLDNLVLAAGLAGPIFTIPQIRDIYYLKTAEGVSAISWSAFLLFSVIWLTYGVVHKEKPLILANILWIIFDAVIVIGTVIY